MKKLFLVVLVALSLSSVACSPSLETAPLTPASAPSVSAPKASLPLSSPSCDCEGKGEDCIAEGSKRVGSGLWDLTKRGAKKVGEVASETANDPENQKKASDAWEAVKEGVSDLYNSAKDAVK